MTYSALSWSFAKRIWPSSSFEAAIGGESLPSLRTDLVRNSPISFLWELGMSVFCSSSCSDSSHSNYLRL